MSNWSGPKHACQLSAKVVYSKQEQSARCGSEYFELRYQRCISSTTSIHTSGLCPRPSLLFHARTHALARPACSTNMAFTFIGLSPNPLPLPAGLTLESQRFTGHAQVPNEQRPRAPSKLKVRYNKTDPEGRLKGEMIIVDPLPANCTVRELQSLLHEHLSISPRHPLVLKYHGQPLEVLGTGSKGEEHMERPLAYYAIKEHSELTVIVKPMIGAIEARELARPDGIVSQLRVMSHKLHRPIELTFEEELTPGTKIKDIYLMVKDICTQKPIFLIAGPEPPLPIGARPVVPFVLAEPLWDGTAQLDARCGDQLEKEGGGAKGGGNFKRISDGNVGAIAETELWKFQIEKPDERVPERWPAGKDDKEIVGGQIVGPKRWRPPSLQIDGVVLDDESSIVSHHFLNNEILYLDFAAPWDPPPEKPGAAGGGKKKKVQQRHHRCRGIPPPQIPRICAQTSKKRGAGR